MEVMWRPSVGESNHKSVLDSSAPQEVSEIVATILEEFLFTDGGNEERWRHCIADAFTACERELSTPRDDGRTLEKIATQITMLGNRIQAENSFRARDDLLTYVDAGRIARIARRLIVHLALKYPDVATHPIALAEALDRVSQDNRGILLALGAMYLEAEEWDKAAATARASLAVQAQCIDAQRLLYDALLGKRGAGIVDAEPSDISLADLTDRFCSRPFTHLVTGYKGESFICDCPGYLPFTTGSVLKAGSIDDIWNGDAAQEIRRSILEGDYRYCSRTLCGMITGDFLPKRDEVKDPYLRSIIDESKVTLERSPLVAQLSHDPSCNLACPSCRSEIITLKSSEQGIYNSARDRIVVPLLNSMNGVAIITGGGDPFGSKHYRSILESIDPADCPDLSLSLLTNGLLATPKQWDSIRKIHPIIRSLLVSVDAARPETYEVVRRPGKMSTLLPNLEFLAERRRAGDFSVFGMCFVVQKLNYREMPEFVALGKRLGVDSIWFQRLVNFGSFTSAEIRDNDVANPTHPDHADFQKILEHPSMQEPFVFLFEEFVEESSLDPSAIKIADGHTPPAEETPITIRGRLITRLRQIVGRVRRSAPRRRRENSPSGPSGVPALRQAKRPKLLR